MTEHRLRLAIVGCGLAALAQYVPALRYSTRGVVAALCDPNPLAMELLGRYFPDAAHFTSYEELLASDEIDAVLLITPPGIHRAQTEMAAKSGKHVFSEKPMAPTVADCEAMIAACQDAGVVLAVGFMKRFDKSLVHVKNSIDGGSLGTPYRLTAVWGGNPLPSSEGRDDLASAVLNRQKNWRGGLESGGGPFADLGAHTIDVALWWFGDIETVSGEFEIIRSGSLVDDGGTGVYRHKSGASSVHLLGWANKPWDERYQIDGTEATLDVHFGPGPSHTSTDAFQIIRYSDGGLTMANETLWSDWSMDLELARNGRYTLEIEDFCAAVQDGHAPVSTGEDGRRATEVILATYVSAYLGEKITLPFTTGLELDEIFLKVAERPISQARL